MSSIVKKTVRNARRRAREFALQGLYAWLLDPRDAAIIDAEMRTENGFAKSDTAHFNTMLYGVIQEHEKLSALLTPCLDRPLNELSAVERAALLIGAYEFAHCIDIPYRVVINEAVELTKMFGGTDGYKFVNGVLDKLAPTLRSTEVQSDASI